MTQKPVAAGKSSIKFINPDDALDEIISDSPAVYLDLACGIGNYTVALAQRLGKDCEIYALDLWEDGIATLQERARELGFPGIKAMVADITQRLPLEDDSVDVCFMANILHDLPADTRADVIREVRRVLTPKGVAIVIEFKKLDYGPGPSKEHKLGEADLEALFIPLGFKKEAVVSLGEFIHLNRFSVL